VRPIHELDEREAARAAGLAIHRKNHLRRRRDRAEIGPQIGLGGRIRQIADEETDRQTTLLY
jgi:hypothetical protein